MPQRLDSAPALTCVRWREGLPFVAALTDKRFAKRRSSSRAEEYLRDVEEYKEKYREHRET